jgi:membrane fusion protein (multidrug efflux system)
MADISAVVARVGGYVDSDRCLRKTNTVNKGQELVKIDDRDYKVKLEQALAAKKGAAANVGVGQSQIFTTHQQILQVIKAQMESAKAAHLDKVAKRLCSVMLT